MEGGGLGADVLRVHRVAPAADQELVEGVLDEWTIDVGARKALQVRLVLGEDELGRAAHVEPALPERLVLGLDGRELSGGRAIAQPRAARDVAPRPRVAIPERGQQVQYGRLGAAVDRRDADQHVLVRRLGVFDEDVEVAVGGEHAGVEQLELRLIAAAAVVLLDELRVRVCRLRILVEELHVGVRRSVVEIEVVLLHVLGVVAFGAAQPEQPFLEDRVAAVPEGDGEAQPLVVVADAADPILAPAIRARARVVVRQVVPSGARGAVVFADGPPLSLAEIRTPAAPVHQAPCRLVDAQLLGGRHRRQCAISAAACAAPTSAAFVSSITPTGICDMKST